MQQKDHWQGKAIEELEAALRAREDVIALALFGSAIGSDDTLDAWSDVDCLIVVEDEAYARYYPSIAWLEALGPLFAYEQSETPFHATMRTCFADFRRFDFVITTPSKLNRLSDWPYIPFWKGTRLLFSRRPQVTQKLDQVWVAPRFVAPSQEDFDAMANRFWFKAMLAGYKVLRNDRLIALHLALDLVRDCCVLGMMIRDRVEGTNVHREGGLADLVVDRLAVTCTDHSADGILNLIEESTRQFEQLTREWSEGHAERSTSMHRWLEDIRHTLRSG